jgi:hypothetical protein
MGNRFRGGIKPGAMPFLHKYLGNPVLTFVGKLFFKSKCDDFHCGLRGFSRESILKLDLKTSGMEFASEMVVKATVCGLKIAEVPTVLSPDGRSRAPHLRTWRDGWRHLRFLLMYSPRWLFLYPGIFLMGVGSILVLWLFTGPKQVGSIGLDVHTMLVGCLASIIGYQLVTFSAVARIFAFTTGLLPENKAMENMFQHVTLEKGLILGLMGALAGAFGMAYAVYLWSIAGFGALLTNDTLRLIIPSGLLACIGVQTIFTSFLLSLFGVQKRI